MNLVAPVRVLLIEDEKADAFLIEEFLLKKSFHYQINWFNSFAQINEIILSGKIYDYDVILIDHFLGSHTGLDILEILAEKKINLPKILITGISNINVDIQAMRLGASDFIIKGQFDSEILDRSIRYAIELKKNQKLLVQQQQKDALLYKATAMADMASFVAHEINNPLSAIQGNIATLKILAKNDKLEKEKVIDVATKVNSLINRIIEIKNNLKLQFTNIARKNLIKYDLILLIRESISLCRDKIESSKINIFFEPEENLFIECLPIEISQVFINLINNACEAINNTDSQPWLKITIYKIDENRIEIHFEDNGKGISVETRANLFTKFYTTKNTGTGVGLHLSKSIIESYSGKFYLNSDNFKTTQFIIELPTTQVECTRDDLKILIIDDQEDFAELIAENINEMKFDEKIKVEVETNPLQALEKLKSSDYDAILLDLHMPEMNGIDFALNLKNNLSKMPAISFMSSFYNKSAIETINSNQLGKIYEKPFDLKKLINSTVENIRTRNSHSH